MKIKKWWNKLGMRGQIAYIKASIVLLTLTMFLLIHQCARADHWAVMQVKNDKVELAKYFSNMEDCYRARDTIASIFILNYGDMYVITCTLESEL